LVTGAIAGFVYGKYQEKVFRDRQAAEAFHNYKPDQGQKVYIEALEVTPKAPVKGESVSLDSTYSVLTGNDEPVPVEITQTLIVDKKVCGRQFCSRTEKVSGSYTGTLPMTIPANAPDGKYELVTVVRTPKAIEQKSYEFVIAKKAEAPATETTGTESAPAQPEGETESKKETL
jgi:hypothetical protein